jgi:hypothetical protein
MPEYTLSDFAIAGPVEPRKLPHLARSLAIERNRMFLEFRYMDTSRLPRLYSEVYSAAFYGAYCQSDTVNEWPRFFQLCYCVDNVTRYDDGAPYWLVIQYLSRNSPALWRDAEIYYWDNANVLSEITDRTRLYDVIPSFGVLIGTLLASLVVYPIYDGHIRLTPEYLWDGDMLRRLGLHAMVYDDDELSIISEGARTVRQLYASGAVSVRERDLADLSFAHQVLRFMHEKKVVYTASSDDDDDPLYFVSEYKNWTPTGRALVVERSADYVLLRNFNDKPELEREYELCHLMNDLVTYGLHHAGTSLTEEVLRSHFPQTRTQGRLLETALAMLIAIGLITLDGAHRLCFQGQITSTGSFQASDYFKTGVVYSPCSGCASGAC